MDAVRSAMSRYLRRLGSETLNVSAGLVKQAEVRYYACGADRYTWGAMPTTYRYTGQRSDAGIGLYYYGARYYDPALGRFVQADTIVPEPGKPQGLNRYTYVLNNPLRYSDPAGRFSPEAIEEYLRQIYGNKWQEMLSLWQSQKDWWAYLLEAKAGDILVTKNQKGELEYTQFLGEEATDEHSDRLLGIAALTHLSKVGEPDNIEESAANLANLMSHPLVALTRYSSDKLFLQYWNPKNKWTAMFVNTPGTYIPKPGETMTNLQKGLGIAAVALAIGSLVEFGVICGEGAVITAPTGVGPVFFGGMLIVSVAIVVDLFTVGLNVANTPEHW